MTEQLPIAQGFQPIDAFDNPVFTTQSPRDYWGKKWNLQVNTSFKRCVFVPLRKMGIPPILAALVTFVSRCCF